MVEIAGSSVKIAAKKSQQYNLQARPAHLQAIDLKAARASFKF